jgi:hypothetical protein
VSHTQYIGSSDAGNHVRALDAVLCYCLERAGDRGARFFDFGTCSLHAGMMLNDGLYAFKARFGGGGVACDQYEVALRAAAPESASPTSLCSRGEAGVYGASGWSLIAGAAPPSDSASG